MSDDDDNVDVGEPRISASRNVTSFSTRGDKRPRRKLYVLFLWLRLMARGLTSTPTIVRSSMCGARSECNSSEMQPLPLHRSRMRKDLLNLFAWCPFSIRSVACDVYDSVSPLVERNRGC